uniref:Uncharacterized protein n=1 Tax=Podoviridae sp. ctnCN2 TaxID=2825274 RepID=A0A8S5PM88_9CAUD|nr:MAG TPA: hypothetical protein [Podoviridae sp. ctnCN2]
MTASGLPSNIQHIRRVGIFLMSGTLKKAPAGTSA